MASSVIAMAAAGNSPSPKEKTEKCGCCGGMFVTLARHYRANAVIKDGVATISESKCAKWARVNNIDPKSQSTQQTKPKKPAGRKALVRSIRCLFNAEMVTDTLLATVMERIDAKFPKTEDDEEEEEEEED
jgi:protein gp37